MDLYGLLGLTRSASGAEIERAYRRLARRYHPGVNPGDRVAEQVYAQIQEAYRVLADEERRREYDRTGGPTAAPAAADVSIAFEGFDFSAPAEGPRAATFSELFADVFQHAARVATSSDDGRDLQAVVRVGFLDALAGTHATFSISRYVLCGACGGHGRVSRPATACQTCGGTGQRRWARGHMVFSQACERCGGAGHVANDRCPSCRGATRVLRTEVVTVPIPAGVESGTRIAVPGHGHAGGPGRPDGDLYVTVDVAPHPYFRRRGRDVCVTLPLGVHEAALGAVVEVPAPGGPVRVRVPAGTTSGAELRVREHGVPGTPPGDLIVEPRIVLPATIDEASRKLLERFGARHDMAAARRSFFDQP
jgi:molecular chaperone DnaJ